MRPLSTFSLATRIAIVGIAIVVGIGVFSLTKRNLVKMIAVADAANFSEQHIVIPQVYIRTGYVGEFGLISALPQTTAAAISRLPEIENSTPTAAGRPPTAVRPQSVSRPFIRVGLYTSDTAVKVKMNTRSQIITDDGVVQRDIKQNILVKMKYDRSTGEYTVRSGNWSLQTTQAIRLQSIKRNSIATITNYENRPSWNLSLNDNEFYGAIELHYAPATDLVWVINELGIENYIQGIGEAGNENDMAYLKSLLTAARTYAYWNYLYPTKHANEPYLLDGTANDQVYIGYGFTKRAPNIAEAVKQTRGRIVYYEGEPTITPYFSHSDGRTRAWSEVWAGEYPHLLSVSDPCCTGETLLGHGVGMSASGARYFAENENWGWKKILKYYYTGVTVPKVWE